MQRCVRQAERDNIIFITEKYPKEKSKPGKFYV